MGIRRTKAKARVRVMIEVDSDRDFDGTGSMDFVCEMAVIDAIATLKSVDGVKVLGDPEVICVITEQVKP